MTPNELHKLGVRQKHLDAFKQLREPNMKKVTKVMLDFEGFGKSLRRLREDTDISLREMARRLKLSATFLSQCECGTRQLSISHCLLFIKECNP